MNEALFVKAFLASIGFIGTFGFLLGGVSYFAMKIQWDGGIGNVLGLICSILLGCLCLAVSFAVLV